MMTSTPQETQPLEEPLQEQSEARPTPLGDDPAGRDDLIIEHLEDRVLMSSDAAVAMAPPETATPTPAAYVASQQPGEQTAGSPPASSGSPVIEVRAALAEVVDAAAETTAEVAHGEGESRGAAGGTPGNPQAPSQSEPKEPVELRETRSELPEKGEMLVEHGEKQEPRDPTAELEGDDAANATDNARTRSTPASHTDAVSASDVRTEAAPASAEPTNAPTTLRPNINPDLGEGAVETKLEVVAEVDLASLRQPAVAQRVAEPGAPISNGAGAESSEVAPSHTDEHTEAEPAAVPITQAPAEPATGRSSAELASSASESVEAPQAHDAVFDVIATQGVADAVHAGAPALGGGQPAAFAQAAPLTS